MASFSGELTTTILRSATVSIRSFLVNEYDQFDMTGALRTSRDGTMVPCTAMRFALAHPRRFEEQPGLPRRLCVFWEFLIEGPLLIGGFLRNPYANAQYDCGCPGTWQAMTARIDVAPANT